MSQWGNGSFERGTQASLEEGAERARKARVVKKKLARVDKYTGPVGRIKPVGVPQRPTVQLDLFGARVK